MSKTPPQTVKIKDGQGDFLTINKSNFKEGVHELYVADEVVADEEEFEPEEEFEFESEEVEEEAVKSEDPSEE